MRKDWTVICFLNIIGFVTGTKVKIYGLDVQFDESSSLNTLTLTSTWKGQPNFHNGKLVVDRTAHTLEAIVTANNSQLFKLNGTYKEHNDHFMIKGFISSKFHTGPLKLDIRKGNDTLYKIHYLLPSAEGTLELSLDKHNPMLKLTPKNGQPMELTGRNKTLNNQWLIELSGNSNSIKLEGNFALDMHNLHKMKGILHITEGSKKKFDLDINTVDLPNKLEIFPASKAGIPISRSLASKRDTFFLEGDYELWKKININSNHQKFSSFRIDTMRNNMLRVELNHKEIFQQTSAPEYPKTKNFKSLKAPLMLPLGDEGGYNLNIASDSLRKNTVNLDVKLGDTEMISVNWDTSNLSNTMLKAEWFRNIEQP